MNVQEKCALSNDLSRQERSDGASFSCYRKKTDLKSDELSEQKLDVVRVRGLAFAWFWRRAAASRITTAPVSHHAGFSERFTLETCPMKGLKTCDNIFALSELSTDVYLARQNMNRAIKQASCRTCDGVLRMAIELLKLSFRCISRLVFLPTSRTSACFTIILLRGLCTLIFVIFTIVSNTRHPLALPIPYYLHENQPHPRAIMCGYSGLTTHRENDGLGRRLDRCLGRSSIKNNYLGEAR